MDDLLRHQSEIHGGVFYGAIILVVVWELVMARRPLTHSVTVRWFGNISIALINGVLARWAVPMAAIGAALIAEDRGWGLLNTVTLPAWLAAAAAFLAIDLIRYFEHRVYHAVPVLWRIHMVHHSDMDVDFTTGTRHHPLEALLSGVFVLAVMVALGAPPVVVLIYETVYGGFSVLTHGNVALSTRIDRVLRLVVVTPDMHRVHHSARQPETDSNYGGIYSWWDRLFGTYCAQPAGGHEGMTLGLEYFREPGDQHLPKLLLQPFVGTIPPRSLRQPGRAHPVPDGPA